jgi:signal transduction histidine kinase
MNFEVEQHVPDGLPYVGGDLPALSQCLQNLVVNAIKYSGKNRWIGISVELFEAEDHRDEVCISVQDRGLGIDISELRHIFEPFYRSPSVMAAQIRGTGLGLAVARRIAQAMGGDLTVKSELEVGSVFTLHLPAADESAIIETTTAVGQVGTSDE